MPWLGSIPEHWRLRRMKHLLHERNEKGFPDEPLLAATQTRGVVRKEQYESRTVLALKDLHLLKHVHIGDFVISLRSFQGGIEYAREHGIISPAYTVLFPTHPTTHGFLAWFFKSKPYIENLSLFVTGIRQGQNVDYEKLSRSELPLPPKGERESIVQFLSYADRRIRSYIRTKQKLIQLLEEQKQAIIHRAVTRGLDPNVHFRPSGVEWLGDVPEGWEVKPVGNFCPYISYGFTNPMPTTDDGPFMLTANDIGNGRILYETARHTSQIAYDSLLTSKSRPQKGDILVTKDGTLGRVAVSDGRFACINQSVALLRVDQRQVQPEYLTTALASHTYLEQMILDAGGTTIKHIYITRLSKMRMSIPPLSEQNEILREVREKVTGLDLALRCAQQEIELIRAYRTRLITDVVSGKLDVREAAAKLPREAAEAGVPQEADVLVESDEGSVEVEAETMPEEAEA